MKNIYEIFKSVGITIPEDKKEEFDKLLNENYKTVAEVTKIQSKLESAETERDNIKSKYDDDIKQRDTDIKDLKSKLKDAGTDSEKLAGLQTELSTLQETYKQAKTDYEKQLSAQAYEFAVKEKVAGIKFSSNSAKKAFMADLKADPLKMKDGDIIGFDDFVNKYKEQDAGAFITEQTDPSKKPTFSTKVDNKPNAGKTTEPTETEKKRPLVW